MKRTNLFIHLKIQIPKMQRDWQIKIYISVRAQEHLNDIRNQEITSGPYSHNQSNPTHRF